MLHSIADSFICLNRIFWITYKNSYDVNPTIGLWLLAEYPVLPGCEAFGCFARGRRGTNGLKRDCAVGSALPTRLAADHLRNNNEAEQVILLHLCRHPSPPATTH